MPNRYLKESICTSDNFNLLSLEEKGFWLHVITSTDDFGRADARPEIIKGLCFPLSELTTVTIDRHLEALQRASLVQLYNVEGRSYLQFMNWEKHNRLRAKKSRFPAMDSSFKLLESDSACQQMSADDNIRGHMRPEVEVEVEVEVEKRTLSPSVKKPRKSTVNVFDFSGHFEELWRRYPAKDGKKAAMKHFKATVKTDADFKAISAALDIYLDHLNLETWKQPKNGATWFNNWQDWQSDSALVNATTETWEDQQARAKIEELLSDE